MRRALVLVALLAGCASPDVPGPDLPATIGAAPPMPTPRWDGEVPAHRCSLDAVFAWPGPDRTFDGPAAAPRDAWLRADVGLVVSAADGRTVRLQGHPDWNGTAIYALDANETNVLEGMAYGRWYAWRVEGIVRSDDPSVDGLPLFGESRALDGWLLRYRGRDDHVYAYLDGRRLPEDPFLRVPLPGGDLFVSPRGVCP